MVQEIPEEILLAQVGQKALIKKGDAVLICRGPGSPERWDIPGGRIHKEEDPREALKREIHEELGVDVHVGKPFDVFVEQMTSAGHPRYFVLFEATLVDDNAEFTLADDEIAEVRWVRKDDVDTLAWWPGWQEIFTTYFKERT